MYLNVVSYGEKNEIVLFLTSETLGRKHALACALSVLNWKPEQIAQGIGELEERCNYLPMYLMENPLGVPKLSKDDIERIRSIAGLKLESETGDTGLECPFCGKVVDRMEILQCGRCRTIMCPDCAMEMIESNDSIMRICPRCWQELEPSEGTMNRA